MSVVILGGNQCMERQYKDLCREYHCQVKVFAKPIGSLRRKLGCPDLMIFFTSTMSHKMAAAALSEIKGLGTVIERSRTSSVTALRGILESHVQEVPLCQEKC